MTEKGIVFRPLFVVQSTSRTEALAKIYKKPQYISQVRIVRHFINDLNCRTLRPVLIRRTQAKFDPATDKVFQNLLEVAKEDQSVILVDDFIPLIDTRDHEQAIIQADYLKNATTLYSIAHGSLLRTISRKTIQSLVAAKFRDSMFRSESIKKGLKKKAEVNGSSKPTRKAINKGAKTKSKIADVKAQALLPEIERIRQSMPLESRGNLTALADAMNAAGVETSRGRGQWQGGSVRRVLDRMDRITDAAPK